MASATLLAGSFGAVAAKEPAAPAPSSGESPGRTLAAATASAASCAASALPLDGRASRSEPQPGRPTPSSEFGTFCSAGTSAQLLSFGMAWRNFGVTAMTTGVLTRLRLSLTILVLEAAFRRAEEIELPGIHNAGCSPSSAGHWPVSPLITLAESAGRTDTVKQ
ncbi:Uncharacterised protein [Mycobacteroides abscessus]|nr:Uncharacterised protein [Mycobacteroides abscessus]